MRRRSFLGVSATAALAVECSAAVTIPIIDTHIHLFDPRRPQGIPWPPKTDQILYRPALPDRYRKIAVPLGVRGAIEVEASPWLQDNQWVLDVAAKDKIIVGTIGNLDPGQPDFGQQLERFHRNPLFRGIRCGNLWNRNLAAGLHRPDFVSRLKLLAQADLALDTANQDPDLIAATVRITELIPDLRVVIDHLPQMPIPADAAAARNVRSHLHQLGQNPNVYVKLSEVLRRIDDQVPTDLSVYRAHLDEIYGLFGEDRVLFGSDWPNSDSWRPYPDVLHLVQQYFATKGAAAARKYFWTNSVHAYRWVQRDASQPQVFKALR